ncbi:MAG: thiamine-phosphate kinase [Desulfovibrionaceae bacterium]
MSRDTTAGGGMGLVSEDHILACIARHFPGTHPAVLLGRGDDCAVLRAGADLCVSSDLFLEDVHFRRSYFRPEEVGHKALAVNISDVAACGGRPLGFTLSLGLPRDVDMPWLEGFFRGMAALADRHRMALVGGDLSGSPCIHVSITVWGEVRADSLLTRGNGLPGDSLFVVGPLGLARVGLEELEARGDAARALWPDACRAHLLPLPQVDAGMTLARAGFNARPPALMDVSDGLARDLPRLLGITPGGAQVSGRHLGAELLLPQGMLPPEVVRHAREKGRNAVTEALLGGEDYALLGSCAPDMLPALKAALPQLMPIGTVTSSGRILCNGQPLEGARGFDHFGGA